MAAARPPSPAPTMIMSREIGEGMFGYRLKMEEDGGCGQIKVGMEVEVEMEVE
jgi:hypothetical protein